MLNANRMQIILIAQTTGKKLFEYAYWDLKQIKLLWHRIVSYGVDTV